MYLNSQVETYIHRSASCKSNRIGSPPAKQQRMENTNNNSSSSPDTAFYSPTSISPAKSPPQPNLLDFDDDIPPSSNDNNRTKTAATSQAQNLLDLEDAFGTPSSHLSPPQPVISQPVTNTTTSDNMSNSNVTSPPLQLPKNLDFLDDAFAHFGSSPIQQHQPHPSLNNDNTSQNVDLLSGEEVPSFAADFGQLSPSAHPVPVYAEPPAVMKNSELFETVDMAQEHSVSAIIKSPVSSPVPAVTSAPSADMDLMGDFGSDPNTAVQPANNDSMMGKLDLLSDSVPSPKPASISSPPQTAQGVNLMDDFAQFDTTVPVDQAASPPEESSNGENPIKSLVEVTSQISDAGGEVSSPKSEVEVPTSPAHITSPKTNLNEGQVDSPDSAQGSSVGSAELQKSPQPESPVSAEMAKPATDFGDFGDFGSAFPPAQQPVDTALSDIGIPQTQINNRNEEFGDFGSPESRNVKSDSEAVNGGDDFGDFGDFSAPVVAGTSDNNEEFGDFGQAVTAAADDLGDFSSHDQNNDFGDFSPPQVPMDASSISVDPLQTLYDTYQHHVVHGDPRAATSLIELIPQLLGWDVNAMSIESEARPVFEDLFIGEDGKVNTSAFEKEEWFESTYKSLFEASSSEATAKEDKQSTFNWKKSLSRKMMMLSLGIPDDLDSSAQTHTDSPLTPAARRALSISSNESDSTFRNSVLSPFPATPRTPRPRTDLLSPTEPALPTLDLQKIYHLLALTSSALQEMSVDELMKVREDMEKNVADTERLKVHFEGIKRQVGMMVEKNQKLIGQQLQQQVK